MTSFKSPLESGSRMITGVDRNRLICTLKVNFRHKITRLQELNSIIKSLKFEAVDFGIGIKALQCK